MKRLVLLILGLFFAIGTLTAGNLKPIKVKELPEKAQQFLKTHCKGVEISMVRMEKEALEVSYEVRLANNGKIEFNRKGEWEEAEYKGVGVPVAIIPKNIRAYVADHFKGARIDKITKEYWGYEVELSNGVDLKFDSKGDFKRMDD